MYLWCFEHIYKIKKGSPTFIGFNSVTDISDYECLCFFLWFFNRSGSTDRFRECRLCDVCCASYTSYFVVRPQSSDSSIQGNTERNSVRETTSEGGILPVRRFRQRVREFRGHIQLIMNAILEKKRSHYCRAKLELKSKKLLSPEILAPNPRFLPQQHAFWWCPPSSFIIFMKISCQFTCAWVERGLVRGTNSVSQWLIIQLQNRHSLRFESSRIQRFFFSPMSPMKLFSVSYWVLLKPTKQHTFLQRHINVL